MQHAVLDVGADDRDAHQPLLGGGWGIWRGVPTYGYMGGLLGVLGLVWLVILVIVFIGSGVASDVPHR